MFLRHYSLNHQAYIAFCLISMVLISMTVSLTVVKVKIDGLRRKRSIFVISVSGQNKTFTNTMQDPRTLLLDPYYFRQRENQRNNVSVGYTIVAPTLLPPLHELRYLVQYVMLLFSFFNLISNFQDYSNEQSNPPNTDMTPFRLL